MNAQDLNALRLNLAGDPQRPTYHFLSPSNWINDPHGMVQWNDQYHLFYQYNPNGPFHSTIHWGHAVSDDLVHWRDLPIALAPGPEPYDLDGCWTGCLVFDEGRPTILYTAAYPQTIAGAISYDELITWQKLAENPLIDGPPEELRPYAGGHFRDPFVWRTDSGWEMLAVSKIEGQGGQVLLYHSPDLRQWHYVGIFLSGDSRQYTPFWQGTMWECPNWLDFGRKQVLVLSIQATPTEHLYTVYHTGKREGSHFEPEYSEILVHGGSFYAPQVMRLSDGRLVMIGWLHEGRSQQACIEAGWNGALSLPMELNLLEDNSVAVTPVEELKSLRGEHRQLDDMQIIGESEFPVPKISGKALEIEVEFTPYGASAFGLKVLRSPGGEEQTSIVYYPGTKQIFVERDRTSLDQRTDVNPATMPVNVKGGESLHMRIFVDHSIIGVFVNGRFCLATRVYPTRDDSDGICLFALRGLVEVKNFHIWKLNAIWPVTEEQSG